MIRARTWWILAAGSAAGIHLAALGCIGAAAAGRGPALRGALDTARVVLIVLAAAAAAGLAVALVRRRKHAQLLAVVPLAAVLVAGTQYSCARDVQIEAAEVETRAAGDGQAYFDHSAFDAVLARHVDDHGMVDYAALKLDRAALDRYLGQLASASPRSRPALFPGRAHEMAYWINAYNALMMRAVIDHYPIDSVTDIMVAHGVFSRMRFPVGGARMTLDDIEKGTLLPDYDEPRVHWVLTCASMSCPRIAQRAYHADRLDQRLAEKTRLFLRSPRGVQVDADRGVVRLSKYFDWYGDDFGDDHLDYVRPYLDEETRRRLEGLDDPEVEYMSYDWRLNDQNAPWAPR